MQKTLAGFLFLTLSAGMAGAFDFEAERGKLMERLTVLEANEDGRPEPERLQEFIDLRLPPGEVLPPHHLVLAVEVLEQVGEQPAGGLRRRTLRRIVRETREQVIEDLGDVLAPLIGLFRARPVLQRRALELDASLPLAYLHLGEIELARGDASKAVQLLEDHPHLSYGGTVEVREIDEV